MTSSNTPMVCLAILVAIASVAALPVNRVTSKEAAPIPPAPSTSCLMANESTCMANDCCNWCASTTPIPVTNVSIGFCMPMVPFGPVPTLVCEKTATDCKSVVSPASCVLFPDCNWVPFGPPGTPVGMCVYNWSHCKSPSMEGIADSKEEAALTRLAMKKAAEEAKMAVKAMDTTTPAPGPTPKPPKPTMCNMTTNDTCNDCECCQWCQTAFNLTGGFCLTVGPFPPPPALNCSKGAVKCEAFKLITDCQAEPLCAWLPVSPTKGKCLFNWNKCKLPPSYGPGMLDV